MSDAILVVPLSGPIIISVVVFLACFFVFKVYEGRAIVMEYERHNSFIAGGFIGMLGTVWMMYLISEIVNQ